MPKIKTSTGYIRYKTQILYPGVKIINKEIASKNLSAIRSILNEERINFMLIAGTLLGAIRENDFISHDEDIDLAFLEEDKQEVIDVLPKIINSGFCIARYDIRGLISIIKNGEYIDFYFFRSVKGENLLRTCCGWLIPDKFLRNHTQWEFKGETYTIPKDYIEYLKYEYGLNWETPIKWFNYETPKWKRVILSFKELIKENLPMCIKKIVLANIEKRFEKKFRKQIEIYIANGGSLS